MFFNKSLSTMDQNSVAFANVRKAVKRICIYQNMAFVFNIFSKITYIFIYLFVYFIYLFIYLFIYYLCIYLFIYLLFIGFVFT